MIGTLPFRNERVLVHRRRSSKWWKRDEKKKEKMRQLVRYGKPYRLTQYDEFKQWNNCSQKKKKREKKSVSFARKIVLENFDAWQTVAVKWLLFSLKTPEKSVRSPEPTPTTKTMSEIFRNCLLVSNWPLRFAIRRVWTISACVNCVLSVFRMEGENVTQNDFEKQKSTKTKEGKK